MLPALSARKMFCKLNPNYEGGKQEPQKSVYEDYESRTSLVDDKEQHDFRLIPLWKGVQDCKKQESAGKKKIFRELIQEFLYKIQNIERMEHQIGRKTNDLKRSSLLNAFLGMNKMNKIQDELLLDEKSLLQRSEKKKTFEKPGAFSSELKWKIQEISDKNPDPTTNMKNYLALSLPLPGPVVVTAYPACSFLAQSDGRKSVKHGTEPQDLRDNLEKFSNPIYVFSHKGVTTHVYAEGFVKRREGIWPVEVATKSVRGKDHVSIGPKEWMWAMGKWIGSYPDISLPCCSVLSLSEKTKEVQGYLNNAAGQVGFLDGEMRTQIDAILEVPLSAVSVQPFFYM